MSNLLFVTSSIFRIVLHAEKHTDGSFAYDDLFLIKKEHCKQISRFVDAHFSMHHVHFFVYHVYYYHNRFTIHHFFLLHIRFLWKAPLTTILWTDFCLEWGCYPEGTIETIRLQFSGLISFYKPLFHTLASPLILMLFDEF